MDFIGFGLCDLLSFLFFIFCTVERAGLAYELAPLFLPHSRNEVLEYLKRTSETCSEYQRLLGSTSVPLVVFPPSSCSAMNYD